MVAVIGLQFGHYGCPKSSLCHVVVIAINSCCGSFLCGVGFSFVVGSCQSSERVGFFFSQLCRSFRFFGIGSIGRSVAFKVEFHLRRRQTILVVACAILQITFNMIGFSSYLISLNKAHGVFKVAQLHFKQFVVVAQFFSFSLQFSCSLSAFGLFGGNGSRDRSTAWQSCRVDMPSVINLSSEDNINFCR